MMMIHIKNVTLMSFARGGKLEFTDDAAIIVKGNRIEYAGPVSRLPVDAEFDEVIDGGGCLAMPALANAHSHSAMNLLRGLGSDLNLHDWLHDKIFPAEARMTAEDAYVGASLAFREMLSFGISACCDMYFHSDSILEAARDTGIRIAMVNPVVGADGGDTSQLDGIYALHKKWHGAANDRIRIMTGLHAEYTSVPELVTKVSAQARELNARVHVHCAETASETLGCVSRYGKSPVKYFADLGLFDNPTVAALCTLLLLTILLVVALTLSSRVFSEFTSFAVTLPRLVSRWVTDATTFLQSRLPELDVLDESTRNYIQETIVSIGRTLTSSATSFASSVARGVWNTATVKVPQVMLFVTLTFMGTFYFSSDRDRILCFMGKLVPPNMRGGGAFVKANLLVGILSQIRASLIMMFITFTELAIGFSLIHTDYVLLLALVISVLDALPVVGTGLFLLPMSIISFFNGDYRAGIGALLIYIIVGIVRQTLEPRIIGHSMGLHPLATMMAMYASYRVIGVLGMLLGPMILMLCKVILEYTTPKIEPIPAEIDSVPRNLGSKSNRKLFLNKKKHAKK